MQGSRDAYFLHNASSRILVGGSGVWVPVKLCRSKRQKRGVYAAKRSEQPGDRDPVLNAAMDIVSRVGPKVLQVAGKTLCLAFKARHESLPLSTKHSMEMLALVHQPCCS